MAVTFGQFLSHDISLSPDTKVNEDCCTQHERNATTKDPNCFEIHVPLDDPFYSTFNKSCFHLTRSVPHSSSTPSINREQENAITSYLDASLVYGSDTERSKRVRSMKKGKLHQENLFSTWADTDFFVCFHRSLYQGGACCMLYS